MIISRFEDLQGTNNKSYRQYNNVSVIDRSPSGNRTTAEGYNTRWVVREWRWHVASRREGNEEAHAA